VREKERRESSEMHARAGGESERREPGGGQRSGAVAGRQARDRNVYSNGRQAGGRAGGRAVDRRLAPKARLAAPHALNSRAHRRPAVSGHG
jgi:hypothetical protein